MYKLEFTLKQHTPLIHFQHDQAGATLRATEVKPKLDKFIIEKKGVTNIPDNWFSVEAKTALNYKLRVLPTSTEEKFYFTSNPPTHVNDNNYCNTVENEFNASYINQTQYFANNENLRPNIILAKEKVKLGIYYTQIKCSILSYNQDLLDYIKLIINDFFLSENFGCRQSKGFGGFTVDSINEVSVLFDEINLINQYDVVYKVDEVIVGFKLALQIIAQIYKHLKSGRGQREIGGYKKSLLFRYFVSPTHPVRWEKRKIKQRINSNPFKHRLFDGTFQDIELDFTHAPCLDRNNAKNWTDTPPPFQYQYIRSLLGLAESYEFLAKEIEGTRYKYYIKVKSNQSIERFSSPIKFKYIGNSVYICTNSIDPRILNSTTQPATFNFDRRLKINNQLSEQDIHKRIDFITNLETPSDFNIGDFLDFAFRRDVVQERINGITVKKNTLIP